MRTATFEVGDRVLIVAGSLFGNAGAIESLGDETLGFRIVLDGDPRPMTFWIGEFERLRGPRRCELLEHEGD